MRRCADAGRPVNGMSVAELKKFHPAFGPDVAVILSAEASIERRASPGGTGVTQVAKRLKGSKHG